MNVKNHITKLLLATLFVMAVQVVFAFTGHTDEVSKKNKYALKNYSKFTNRGLSISNTKYLLHLKPTELRSNTLSSSASSNLQMTTGNNTTFIYPYKIKVKVPKFKTPSPIN